MNPLIVLRAAPEVDLTPLTSRLWQARIPHRVIQQDGMQHLLLAEEKDVETVKFWLEQWRSGELTHTPEAEPSTPLSVKLHQWSLLFAQAPVTLSFLILMVLVFAGINLGVSGIGDLFSDPAQWNGQKLDFAGFFSSDPVSWIFPAFAHASLVHLIMNALWWWILAKETERKDGHLMLVFLFVVFAFFSSMAQYMASGPYFLGLSGVDYGLAAWIWLRERRYRQRYPGSIRYELPVWLFPTMIFMMVAIIMFEGVAGATNIGHESHLGGAVTGLLLAALWPLRRQADSQVNEHES